jgi:hypothetical protein
MKSKCVTCSKLFADEAALNNHTAAAHPERVPTEGELDSVARQALWAFLNSDGNDRGLLAKAKQANTYRSTEARREQTEGARQATLVMFAREYAETKKEFRELVKVALPELPMLAIADGKPTS